VFRHAEAIFYRNQQNRSCAAAKAMALSSKAFSIATFTGSALPDKLSDIEVYDRLHAAGGALGDEPGQTVAGNTALEAARKALTLFNCAMIKIIVRNET
jgi:hypothetical protein